MHFLLSSMSVVYVLTTPIPEDGGDDATGTNQEKGQDSLEAKYMAKDASSKKFFVSNFTNYKMTDSRPVLEQYNELLGILGSDKPKGNNDTGPSVVNMVEHNNSSRYNDNKGKHKHYNTKADPNKKPKVTCWKCGKPRHLKKDCKGVNVGNKANGSGTKGSVDGYSNSMNGATVHVCKDRYWFKTYKSLNDGSILHIGNESTDLVHGHGCVDLRFSSGKIVLLFNVLHVHTIRKNLVSSSVLNNYGYKQVIESNKFILSKHGVFIGFGYLSNQMFRLNIVNANIALAFMSTFKLNDSILWYARLGHVYFKRMQDMSKDRLILAFDMDTEKCKTHMLTKITKKPFQNVKCKTEVLELIHSYLCDMHATPSLGNKKCFAIFNDDALRFCYVYLLHTKDEALDKFKVFKTEVKLQQGSQIKRFRTDRGAEYMDTLYFQSVSIVHEMTALILYNKMGCKAVVKLPDPKLKTLGKRGIECIFVGYAEHSKAFRFYVIEPNDSVSINSIIESRDAIFDENRFSSLPRPSLRIPNGTEDIGGSVVPKEVIEEVVDQPKPKLRKSKRNTTPDAIK
ncbi:zinc finger, CCHC-type containing protein [Tanacetum coccineum]